MKACLTNLVREKIREKSIGLKDSPFVTDKGKWIFPSLPFSINIGPSAFSYILGMVCTQCNEFTLNYLDDIMIFSETWQEHLEHLDEVFK